MQRRAAGREGRGVEGPGCLTFKEELSAAFRDERCMFAKSDRSMEACWVDIK
jgi:hypothetical protein